MNCASDWCHSVRIPPPQVEAGLRCLRGRHGGPSVTTAGIYRMQMWLAKPWDLREQRELQRWRSLGRAKATSGWTTSHVSGLRSPLISATSTALAGVIALTVKMQEWSALVSAWVNICNSIAYTCMHAPVHFRHTPSIYSVPTTHRYINTLMWMIYSYLVHVITPYIYAVSSLDAAEKLPTDSTAKGGHVHDDNAWATHM